MSSAKHCRAWPQIEPFDVNVFSKTLALIFDRPYDPVEALSKKPQFSGSVAEFAVTWQLHNVLRKYPDLDVPSDPVAAAWDEFIACESQCEETNRRFHESGFIAAYPSILERARKKISRVLGDVPSIKDLKLCFGPGVAIGHGGNPSVNDKLTGPLTITRGACAFLSDLRETLPHLNWCEGVSLVPGSKYATVPKTALTNRNICVEPLINGLLQKGFGSHIRDRLLLFGVDIKNGQRVNRLTAAQAIDRDLATVDLSSASDLISFGLVFSLLPIEWVETLDAIRSHRFEKDGEWREFHKFSSMGCAFTFELETLIFWAIAGSISGFDRVLVYGDDIIIPNEAVDTLLGVLHHCGFRVNREKTFYKDHPFRESCGGDYYLGCDVTPFRIKKQILTVVDVFWLANSLSDWSNKLPFTELEYEHLRVLHAWVLSHVPEAKRLYGPAGMGDGHIHANWDVARPYTWRGTSNGSKTVFGKHVCGFFFHSYVESAKILDLWLMNLSYSLYHLRDHQNGEPWISVDKTGSRKLVHFEENQPVGNTEVRRGVTTKRRKTLLCHSWPEWAPRF